jgi:hypothetical protein
MRVAVKSSGEMRPSPVEAASMFDHVNQTNEPCPSKSYTGPLVGMSPPTVRLLPESAAAMCTPLSVPMNTDPW